jgi:hypothetical protein
MCKGKEGRAEEIQFEKEDLLKKQKDGKGHWKDELASDSESIVCLLPPRTTSCTLFTSSILGNQFRKMS